MIPLMPMTPTAMNNGSFQAVGWVLEEIPLSPGFVYTPTTFWHLLVLLRHFTLFILDPCTNTTANHIYAKWEFFPTLTFLVVKADLITPALSWFPFPFHQTSTLQHLLAPRPFGRP